MNEDTYLTHFMSIGFLLTFIFTLVLFTFFTDLEDKLFETTEKPTEDTEFTTEMDFMYPMILDPITTTKRPEPKMTTSIIDKVFQNFIEQ